MERTLKKAIRTASNVNSLMLLLFYGLIYAAVFGIQLLIPHLGFSDSIYYEAIYEVIVYFVQYVVVVPVLLLLFRVILGRKIGWNLKDSYRKPQASGGQLFRWCLIALGLVYATSMASQIFFNVVEMVTDVELQAPSMVAEENWVGYLNNIVAFAIYAPIFEEMLFRATLFRNTERFGSWFGVITIGITFGLWHCNYEQFFYAAVLGICAAFLTAKTRSVLPAMAIHFTMNFIGTMLSIAYSGLDLDNLDLEVMLQHGRHEFLSDWDSDCRLCVVHRGIGETSGNIPVGEYCSAGERWQESSGLLDSSGYHCLCDCLFGDGNRQCNWVK